MNKEDKIALVLVLLKQLQPYLSAQNLSVAQMKGNGGVRGSAAKGGSGQGEVEALNKILNNINVQTKNDKLPPIKNKSKN
jgi:hypothetical protein